MILLLVPKINHRIRTVYKRVLGVPLKLGSGGILSLPVIRLLVAF